MIQQAKEIKRLSLRIGNLRSKMFSLNDVYIDYRITMESFEDALDALEVIFRASGLDSAIRYNSPTDGDV